MRVIELFSCAGGMAEGLRRAGLPVTLAFDWDADARASYHANLGHAPIGMDARDLLRLLEAGGSLGAIDLLIADPPCTPWSRAGKRQGEADERDMLGVTVEIIRALRPTCALIANVPGLDDAPNWPIVQRTIGSLPYCIDLARLDAAAFGVPQHRVRPFWFCRPRGSESIAWPTRTHGSPDECARPTLLGDPLLPWRTCRDALGHLSAADLGSPIRLRWRDAIHRAAGFDEPAKTATRNGNGDGALISLEPAKRRHRASRQPRASQLDAPAGVVTSRENQGDGTVLVVPHHPPNDMDAPARTQRSSDGGTPDKILQWPWDSPSTVVTSGDRIGPPGHHGGSFLSDANAVKLSEKARAILQGFPESWTFAGKTKASRSGQIGMAMPPPLAEAVGRSILRWLSSG